MIVHFPIALLITSVAFDFVALWWRSERFRETAFSLLVLGLLSAGLAIVTGHVEEEAVEHGGIPERALEIHEMLGFATFWVFAIVLALRLAVHVGVIRDKHILTLTLGIAGVMVLLAASYFGGDLVYGYGAGVLALTTR